MISLEEIEREIKELEARGDTTYSLCERLAWLYVVRDHLRPPRAEVRPSGHIGGTEFLDAASGAPYERLMEVLDQHMQALRVVQPKEYELVMGRIQALKNF